MRDNSLGTEGWCAIFGALRDNKDNNFESWNLSVQGINVEIVKVLAEYISASTALKSLKYAARMLPCPALSAAADALLKPLLAASTATSSAASLQRTQAPHSDSTRASIRQRASTSYPMLSKSTKR